MIFHGLIDEVQLFGGPLPPERITDLSRGGRVDGKQLTGFHGKFDLGTNEVVVFAGGANVVAAQELGYLELLLTDRASRPRFRTLAWEGDTVYDQWRILNFGSWEHQLRRAGAGVVFAQFGQSEILEEATSLERFLGAYEKLLDQFERVTPRVVLISPALFEKSGELGPDLSRHNTNVLRYAEAIGRLAQRRGYLFVDLTRVRQPSSGRLTRNGLHLTPEGQWAVAEEVVRQLRPRTGALGTSLVPGGISVEPAAFETLREAIVAKNRLWFNYWRPMNWAFLYGDRTEQASSRDHRDQRARWFPEELRRFLPLISQADRSIDELAARLSAGENR